ncbi:asparagine synthase (glutamine-hydrolyzing) [Winogradskyella aquimaris]|uniref:asparagine synthase (glutamine-hydrolyzing) n=1 Tax=Winogradskyella aquimaris TaxID=864074 RepID=A0ABU5EQP1_9FLAO|nr:asparagine synthase (glutamine-hydrolyzing) [Winogradskyella aquimaris]MDY2587084.1 asparagine synthase (glutamine-hydrolyzing) [Winogradskyella aquimaris]
MCGINGIFKISHSDLNLSKHITAMNNKLSHRGPDDNGFWIDESEKLALGQTRLSILDLSSAGHQPMHDLSVNNTITYNGEIFNYKLLNERFLKHEKFNSHSDTETLLKLYKKFGIEMLKHLNGMFAFALWDSEKEELILARDRSGKKPLYYTQMNGHFLFSSELKALFEIPWVKKEIDGRVLYDFLTFNSVPTPNTMFKDIFKFKPGHCMVVGKDGIKAYESFNDLKYKKLNFTSEKELEDLVYNKLEESVKLRMISDVPVGAFLSGGVDSSAIVALMRQNTPNEIKTFTIGFEDQPDYNELKYADKISKRYNTNHFVKTVTPNDLLEFIPKITDIYDEPQADTTAIPIYFISQLAKEENIKVVLNGDGPDELFSGYKNYERYVKTYQYYKIVEKAPGFIKGIANTLINKIRPGSPIGEIINRLNNKQDFYWPGAGGMKEGVKSSLISKEFMESVNGHSSYDYVQKLKKDYYTFLDGQEFDFINWLCYSGYRQAITERFLFRADRLGMAHSIEARSPFLNHEMVQLALSIPGEYKIKNGVNKYILKKSLERILPNEILYRKKMGFNLPIREWAKDTIYNGVKDEIKQFNKETNLFNLNTVNSQLHYLKAGNEDYTNSIWTIYFLIHWYKKWI